MRTLPCGDRNFATHGVPSVDPKIDELVPTFLGKWVLELVDRDDPICEIVARKIIEIASSGVTNAVAIAEIAFRQLGLGSSPLDE